MLISPREAKKKKKMRELKPSYKYVYKILLTLYSVICGGFAVNAREVASIKCAKTGACLKCAQQRMQFVLSYKPGIGVKLHIGCIYNAAIYVYVGNATYYIIEAPPI